MTSKLEKPVTVSLAQSFGCAFSGLNHAFKHERNLKIHCVIAIVVIMGGFYLQLNVMQWAIVVLVMGLIFVTELLNTAIERLTDYVFEQQLHPKAKVIKDLAAGACVIAATIAVVIGLLVVLSLFQSVV